MGFVPKPVRFSATFTGFVALNMSTDNLQVYNIVACLRGFAALYTSRISCQCILRLRQGASGSRKGSETRGTLRPARRSATCKKLRLHFLPM